MHIETENDTEVGAAYLTYKMQQGSTLGEALESSLKDLDGFLLLVGTKMALVSFAIQLLASPLLWLKQINMWHSGLSIAHW